MKRYADPHQTLWVLDTPWLDAKWGLPPRETLSPFEILRLDVGALRSKGFEIVVKRRARSARRPRSPQITDVWYARKGTAIVPGSKFATIVARSLWQESGGRCSYCRRPTRLRAECEPKNRGAIFTTIEHRVALSQGGTWKRSNLVSACKTCNNIKGDLDEATFRGFLQQHPPDGSGRFIAFVKGEAKREISRRTKARRAADGLDAASPSFSCTPT